MFRTDVVDIINSGDAWLFVGSGVSKDAGLPSWEELVTRTVSSFHLDLSDAITEDSRFMKGLRQGDYSRCFSRIENHAGRNALEGAVREILASISPREGIVDMLVDWPLEGYVTTNYDHLIEMALNKLGCPGWISVGNSPDEVRKVSGDVDHLVWHVHGSIEMS